MPAPDASPLDALVRATFFEGEWRGDGEAEGAVAVSDAACRRVSIAAYRDAAGVGSVVPEVGRPRVLSVRPYEGMFEGDQRRVLPCGARTLFVDPDGGIVLRGFNKFVEVEDVAGLLVHPRVRGTVVPVCIQRKLAGFVVVIGVVDDELVVSSKHTLRGHHVDIATRLLEQRWRSLGGDPTAHKAALVAFLNQHRVCLLCEAVDPSADTWHPTTEPGVYHTVNLLAVAERGTLQETSRPDLLTAAAAVSGLNTVEPEPLTWALLDRRVSESSRWVLGPDGDTEGWVATFAVPTSVVRRAFTSSRDAAAAAVSPADPHTAYFRVKVKTLRYRVQRRLRQVAQAAATAAASGHTAALDRHIAGVWRGANPHERAVLAYLYAEAGGDPGAFAAAPITEVVAALERRGPAAWRAYVRTLAPFVPASAMTLVLPVGLPGSGKSTAMRAVCDAVATKAACVYVSRDAITEKLRVQLRKVDVTRQVHQEVQRRVDAVVASATAPTVIFVDGAHLTAGARAILLQKVQRSVVVNFRSTPEACLERIAQRGAHPTLAVAAAPDVVAVMASRLHYHKIKAPAEATTTLTTTTTMPPAPAPASPAATKRPRDALGSTPVTTDAPPAKRVKVVAVDDPSPRGDAVCGILAAPGARHQVVDVDTLAVGGGATGAGASASSSAHDAGASVSTSLRQRLQARVVEPLAAAVWETHRRSGCPQRPMRKEGASQPSPHPQTPPLRALLSDLWRRACGAVDAWLWAAAQDGGAPPPPQQQQQDTTAAAANTAAAAADFLNALSLAPPPVTAVSGLLTVAIQPTAEAGGVAEWVRTVEGVYAYAVRVAVAAAEAQKKRGPREQLRRPPQNDGGASVEEQLAEQIAAPGAARRGGACEDPDPHRVVWLYGLLGKHMHIASRRSGVGGGGRLGRGGPPTTDDTPHRIQAMKEHYRVGAFADTMHCTLAYYAGRVPEGDDEAGTAVALAVHRERYEGVSCEIVCDRVQCDAKGLCLRVASVAAVREAYRGLRRVAVPLPALTHPHVTLGVAESVDPKHCLTLQRSLAAWQHANAALADERAQRRAAPTGHNSRDKVAGGKVKFHNCLDLQLPTPVVLRGRVVYTPLATPE